MVRKLGKKTGRKLTKLRLIGGIGNVVGPNLTLSAIIGIRLSDKIYKGSYKQAKKIVTKRFKRR